MYSRGPPHMDVQEWDDQHEPTYSNYVRTQDVTLKTCRRRWMIGRNGERGSGISALAVWHDDDDDNIKVRFQTNQAGIFSFNIQFTSWQRFLTGLEYYQNLIRAFIFTTLWYKSILISLDLLNLTLSKNINISWYSFSEFRLQEHYQILLQSEMSSQMYSNE